MTELSVEKTTELDALYAERSPRDGQLLGACWSRDSGTPACHRSRRGGTVAGGPTLRSVLDFHTWAYERYKLLEEGYDSWIGDDKS